MKLCQINGTYGLGSTGVIAKDINDLAIKCGMEIMSCAQKSVDINTYIIGNKFDWKVHGLSTRLFGAQGYFSRISTYKLIKHLEEESPDIVQLHNLHSNFINIKILFGYLSKHNIKTVLTLHDCWYFTGKCFHFVDSGCNNWRTECNKCPQKHHSVNSWFFDQSNKVFNNKKKLYKSIHDLTIVGCSDWITSLAKESPLFKGARIVTIKNGIDTSIFNNKENIDEDKKNNLEKCFCIACFANKLLDKRNKVIKEFLIDNLANNDRLLIFGCNEKQIEELKHYKNVVCYKYVDSQQEMSKLFHLANVFVNLTIADTLPTVNMESICCGTPVITYNSCGSPELVKEGKTGYIIEPFDCEALKKRIGLIKKNAITRDNCSTIGHIEFDKTKQYQKYIDLFKELINK